MRSPESILAEIEPGLETVPVRLRGGLKRYLVDRVRPGSFLCNLLRNDLAAAVVQADEDSLAGLRDLVLFLHNYAPGPAHGSPGNFEAWLAGGSKER
jgi:hypothetical protein